MVTTDIEMHSPTRRSKLMKRARTPDSDGPYDHRPYKRVSMGLADSLPALFAQAGPGIDSSSRHPTEEWVVQARALRIDSPSAPCTPLESTENADTSSRFNMGEDENMTLDTDESPPSQQLKKIPLQSHDPPLLGLPPPSDPVPHPPQQYQQPLPSPSIASQMDPFSAAIDQELFFESQSVYGHTRPMPGPDAPTHSKRQRFTMGPRADCEKCRLGIKGHSVHFD